MKTSKKARQKRQDLKLAASITSRVTKLACNAGLLPKSPNKRRFSPLPANLEPVLAIRERRLMQRAFRLFEALHRDGAPVFHLTWCPPEFRVPRGALTPGIIKSIRNRVSRCARNIPTELGRRMIGAVDISFNEDASHPSGGEWCVHVHALVAVVSLSLEEAEVLLKRAFRCDPAQLRSGVKIKPVWVQRIGDKAHMSCVKGYVSAGLALVDHNDKQNRHRRYRSRVGSKFSSDTMLPKDLGAEVTELYAALGPKGFWTLSGFRRRGDRIKPEPSFSPRERAALKALRKRRRRVKP